MDWARPEMVIVAIVVLVVIVSGILLFGKK
jgi:hypothetical protein